MKLPGKPFKPAWPSEGEATIAVEGVGSLGATGGQKPVPIASVAKVMTAYLTLKKFPLKPGAEGFQRADHPGRRSTEERERVALDQSTVAVRAGEVLSERQLLEALLLPSANNIAALLASPRRGQHRRLRQADERDGARTGHGRRRTTPTRAASKRAPSRPPPTR